MNVSAPKFKLINLKSRNSVITLLLSAYLLAIVGFMLIRNMSMTPDRFFIILLFAAIIAGRTKLFLRDWVPFIALLIGYEMLRGFADTAGFRVHVSGPLNLEHQIFDPLLGTIPTVWLQSHLFNPSHIAWYDVSAAIIDFLHFPLPLLVGFFLWAKDRRAYWKFVVALLTLSFAGFVTYLLFPAAPPWYADQRAGLVHVNKIIDYVVSQVGWGWDFSSIYSHLNPNQVAAMPSLHSAYPWLAFLALFTYKRRIGLMFLPYPFLVWFSVVYMGEHYVIDVLAGILYASVVYLAIYQQVAIKRLARKAAKSLKRLFGRVSPEPEVEVGT